MCKQINCWIHSLVDVLNPILLILVQLTILILNHDISMQNNHKKRLFQSSYLIIVFGSEINLDLFSFPLILRTGSEL